MCRLRYDERYELGRRRNGQVTLDRTVVQAEVGQCGKEFPVRLHLQERADGDESLDLGIVLKNLFQIVEASGSDLKIADDRTPVAGAESESESRARVDPLKNIALAVDDGAAKGGIKGVLLQDAPGN